MVNESLYRWGMAGPPRQGGCFFSIFLPGDRMPMSWIAFAGPRDRGVGMMRLLHQQGRKEDVLPHDGGDIALPGGRPGLVVQLAQDEEDGDREQ